MQPSPTNTSWSIPGFQPLESLGEGACGTVLKAVHLETGQQVAIKYLSDRVRSDPHHLASFRDEAVLLQNLHSPYVARMFQYVQNPYGSAIVMELVAGASLREVLSGQGRLTAESAFLILKGSLLGLSAAHRTGVVHRDYKPGNVIVTPEGHSKLIDFGIAVPSGAGTGAAGTPAYMAPEQWTGEGVGAPADVYAATVTFFECLTGERPYNAPTVLELAVQHKSAPIPYEKTPGFTQHLIRNGLAKDPWARPRDADRFLATLETVARRTLGLDWEERGRRALAALVAAHVLAGGRGGESGGGQSDAATTRLPGTSRHRRSPRVHFSAMGRGPRIAAAVAALAGMASYGVFATQGTSDRKVGAGSALPDQTRQDDVPEDEPRPVAETPAPSSSSPGPETRPPVAEPAPPTALARPSWGPDQPTAGDRPALRVAPTPVRSTGLPPAVTDPPAPPVVAPPVFADPLVPPVVEPPVVEPPVEEAPTHVLHMSIGRMTAATDGRVVAPVRIVTDGTGPVTISVIWSSSYGSVDAGSPTTQPGPVRTFTLSGRTTYAFDLTNTFKTDCNHAYWNVQVVPSAESGMLPMRRDVRAECVPTPL
ncbi:serine/threonine-protein kinase [Streptomyces sp. NPDC001586]|uniref:serine/threonine-protein kinase n=1 Tax=Streptomyces sp. NPDC001586 TaxID=3154387 RepID=UPI00332B6070